jgi:DNA repair exonuclease SbcCD ATPase subunit
MAGLQADKEAAQALADQATEALRNANTTYQNTQALIEIKQRELTQLLSDMGELNAQSQQTLREVNSQIETMNAIMAQAQASLTNAEAMNGKTNEIMRDITALSQRLDNIAEQAQTNLNAAAALHGLTLDNLEESIKNQQQARAMHAEAAGMRDAAAERNAKTNELRQLLALKAEIEKEAASASKSAEEGIRTGTGFASNAVTLGAAITGTVASTSSLITSAVLAGQIDQLASRIDACEAAVRELQ